MQTSNRYYITRADDHPVVRTIPVALREEDAREVEPTPIESASPPHRSRRMPKIVRPALRKSTRVGSEKL